MTTGDRLRTDMADALAHAAHAAGRQLEFDERERHTIDAAASAADRKEQLQLLLLDADTRASVAVKLAAEIRLCEKHVADLLARMNVGPGQAKSERPQRAAHARWGRDVAHLSRKGHA